MNTMKNQKGIINITLVVIIVIIAVLVVGVTWWIISNSNCAGIGERGPSKSLGPDDPNKDVVCCKGLTLRRHINSFQDNCEIELGPRMICIACGDDECDGKYENKCNCPEDCD